MNQMNQLFSFPMLRSAFCILILSLSASSVSAQAGEADRLVKKIEARYGPMRGLAAEFEHVYSEAGGSARRESGRLFLARPGRMRWEYPGKLFIVNGRDVWFYLVADRVVYHRDANTVSDTRFPFLFLLGQTNLKRIFSTITLVEEESDARTRTLRLIPRTRSAYLRELLLYVTTDGRIMKLKLLQDRDIVTEITLSNVRENYVAPAEAFKFTPPPGVTVRKER